MITKLSDVIASHAFADLTRNMRFAKDNFAHPHARRISDSPISACLSAGRQVLPP